ncbi:MAG: restriction endonuclease subunit S, partial [Thermoguttaceae bacterium]|nr:restriction endonuclease subunit S [Thermoguttaceae bacterium]
MSKLDDLIKELCPEGVEHVELGNVCTINKGVQFNKKDMNETGTYPVVNGGINPSGYIERFNQEENTITISQGGASAGYVNWLSTKFWAGAHCYVVKPCDGVLNRYLYHFIKSKEITLQNCQYGAGIPALAKSTIAQLLIPVPPLPVQAEIVRILDNFTALTAELTAELTKRRQQYEHYRDRLLSFESKTFEVSRLTLGEATNVFRGEYITKSGSKCGNIPVILGGQEPAYYIDHSNHDGEIVVVARSGVSAGFVSYWNEPIFITDGFGFESKPDILLPKFLYHTLKNRETALNAMKQGAGVPHVSGEKLKQVKLLIPSLKKQKRIVEVLDNFDAICSDLNIGLPA